MKTKSLLGPLLAASLFSTLPAGATVPSPLVMNVTLFAQISQETKGDIFRGEVDPVRFNSKDLLELFATQTAMTFPKGARILVDPDGDVTVIDKHGDFIVDVSTFAFADFGDSLFDGFFNIETEQEKSNIFIAFILELNLPAEGLVLELQGVAKEKFTASKPNHEGTQVFKGKINVDVTGRGTWDSELILGEGSIQLKGKEVETKL